jgi:peptidoglycan/LPS O-acetylase OafA/YrhL
LKKSFRPEILQQPNLRVAALKWVSSAMSVTSLFAQESSTRPRLPHSAGGGRIHALDGLRGWAALAVAYYHAILHNDLSLFERVVMQPIDNMQSLYDIFAKLTLNIFHGETAVFVFFILSGAVLRRSLDRYAPMPEWRFGLSFLLVRMARLYPPVIACMVVIWVLTVAWPAIGLSGFPQFSLSQLALNAGLINTNVHGPSTTVQAEMLAVPFLFGAYILQRLLGFPAAVLCFVLSIYAMESHWLVADLPNMNAYLYPFMAGALIAEPRLKAAFEGIPPASGWIALAVLVFARLLAYHASVPAHIAMVIAGMVLVGILLYSPFDLLGALLGNPLSQFLGRISFSFYLLNVPVLMAIWTIADQWSWSGRLPVEVGLAVGTLSVMLTVPFALASERWVERPGMRLGRTIKRKFGAPRSEPRAPADLYLGERAPA